MKIMTGTAHRSLAAKIAESIGQPLADVEVDAFPDGETDVKINENVRGEDVFIIQPSCPPTNHNIMELLIMVDAARRASAGRITAVIPFFGYARQDRKDQPRVPITAKLVANLLTSAGVGRVLTMDLHAPQIQGFFDGPVDHLFALPLLAQYVSKHVDRSRITVVSPDAGRVRVAERWTDILGAPLAIIHKRRDPDVPNEAKVFEVVGDVRDRICVVVDDMIDTGGTIVKAADALFENGAADVIVTATHGVLSDPAAERLRNSRIREVVVTNTLPIPPESHFEGLTVLSIAPLIARAIREVFDDGSVTSLFEDIAVQV
jgi:ribose-phosphate pyrophosphokinase